MEYSKVIQRKNIHERFFGFYDLLVILILGMVPINIFRHGGFQLVDVIIVAAILVTLLKNNNINLIIKKHILLLSFFSLWASIVSIVYAVSHNSLQLLIPGINMAYVFFILYAMTVLFIDLIKRNKYIIIYLGIFLSFVSTLSFKGYWEWEGSRNSFSFNNPNQLGLYAFLILSIIIMLLSYKIKNNINNKIYIIFDVIIIIVTHYFILMAISRSDVIATIVLDLFLLGKLINRHFLVPAAMGILIVILLLFYVNPNFIEDRSTARPADRWTGEAFQDRVNSAIKGPFAEVTGLKIIYGTGYLSVTKKDKDPTQTITGQRRGLEVHNMFFNVLWGYGAIGLILYAFWIFKSIFISRVYLENLFIWAAILINSIGGVLIRFRMLWIMLAFMFALLSIYYDNEEKKEIATS